MGAVGRLACACLLAGLVPSAGHALLEGRTPLTYDIGPERIAIDGDLSDWSDRAFSVGPLTGDGRTLPADDFDVRVRFGWDATGLAVAISVSDDEANEAGDRVREGRYDAVEIRVSDGLDGRRFLIAAVAPGVDPARPELRVEVDPRGSVVVAPTAAARRTEGGYAVEMRVPLEPFGAGAGSRLAVNVVARDRDRAGGLFTVTWFPWRDLSVGGMSHVVRLADTASEPVPGDAQGRYPEYLTTEVGVTADVSLAGRRVVFVDGEREVAAGVLEAADGRAVATLTGAMPPRGRPYADPAIRVDGGGRIPVTIPNADEQRAWRFTWQRIRFDAYAFSGSTFPEARLIDPLTAEHLVGPYAIETAYYDRNYDRVDAPDGNGRYGAVVTITAEETGRVYRRFRTLYKYSGRVRWWERDVDASIALPDEFGIDPVVAEASGKTVADYLKWRFVDGLYRDQRAGALLAGLAERVPGKDAPTVYDDVWAADRSWWVGLKRKVYGMPPAEPINCPTGVFKGRARELVMGPDAEAGFREGFSAAIAAACGAWLAESGQPFSVCIARNGRIAHLASYGEIDGRPVTLSTPAPIASITKLLTGTLMAMAIEHGGVDPDAPVATYLPAFRDVPGADRLTVRRFMNHTSGLEGHWGDDEHDFEEQIAGYAPSMAVGRTYQYNGTGFAIAGKVIEAVSGEALPQFAKRHLLDPLGCADTEMWDTSQSARSTPLDLARIGQMLLNGGAYGDFRFFEYEAMQAFLPRPLDDVIPGTYRQYGLGSGTFADEGLGEGTFGHGASSGTIFRVDPENDLVIVVTRWRHGDGYEEHKQKLFDTIVSHLESKTQSTNTQ